MGLETRRYRRVRAAGVLAWWEAGLAVRSQQTRSEAYASGRDNLLASCSGSQNNDSESQPNKSKGEHPLPTAPNRLPMSKELAAV